MIHGRFAEAGQPFVSASVILPRNAREAKVNFLVDTGADRTCLMPADAHTMRVRYEGLINPAKARGVGGEVEVHREKATVIFVELGVGLITYEVGIDIYPNQEPYDGYPSILGRDVLNQWRINYCHPENALTAEALRHDLLIPLLISPDRPG
jgi:hypothetical protein